MNETDPPHDAAAPGDRRFRHTLGRVVGRACRRTAETALTLYHCLRDADTPRGARLLIGGTLAYLVLPADFIPDIFPVVGFADDWLAILGAMTMVALHIKPLHRRKAAEQWDRLWSAGRRSTGVPPAAPRIESKSQLVA